MKELCCAGAWVDTQIAHARHLHQLLELPLDAPGLVFKCMETRTAGGGAGGAEHGGAGPGAPKDALPGALWSAVHCHADVLQGLVIMLKVCYAMLLRQHAGALWVGAWFGMNGRLQVLH